LFGNATFLPYAIFSDPYHLITTGGEGHFYKRDEDIGYWLDGQWISDYNYNGQGKFLACLIT
jgi:hypothetical protein